MMQTNLQLDLAFNYLENTGTNIFLTGKAGTGGIRLRYFRKKYLGDRCFGDSEKVVCSPEIP